MNPSSWPELPSLFSPLLKYSRKGTATPLENFTTELLAGIVRRDPEPFVAWMSTWLTNLPDGQELLGVATQVPIDSGFVDLVLRFGKRESEAQLHKEVWVEVKCGAPESGDQLARYKAALLATPRDVSG